MLRNRPWTTAVRNSMLLTVVATAAVAVPEASALSRNAAPVIQEDAQKTAESSAGAALDETTRAALRSAPRLKKLGRIRGARIVSDVRFTSAPDVPYELTASFAFPERTRIILSSAGGAYERYRLGKTFFGRDVIRGQENSTQSGLLSGAGRAETHLDMALRRAVFFWPDAPEFTGKGTTYSAKVADLGILLATVDEATGLPTRVRTFGQNGQAGAEMHSIEWGPEPTDEGGRRWPTSMVFAAGGSDVWTETVQRTEADWRFTDAWFLPMDRVTAVMGVKAAGQLRILTRPSAWIRRRALKPEEQAKELLVLASELSAGWAATAAKASASFPEGKSAFVSPFVEIELDAQDRPIAAYYEVTAARDAKPDEPGWTWRAPENAWSHPLEEAGLMTAPGASLAKALAAAREAIAAAREIQASETSSGSPAEGTQREGPSGIPRLIRFQVGEESVGTKSRSRALGFSLVAEAVEAPDSSRK
ncbi:MAG: hypothetical protein AAGG01_08900 [Planctomycetota bacterium]